MKNYSTRHHWCRQEKVDGAMAGVPGRLTHIVHTSLSEQPVTGFDWSAVQAGLYCCTALDQCLRVGMVTKLKYQ